MAETLLVKSVWMDGKKRDIYVEDGAISKIGGTPSKAGIVIDAKGRKAAFPGLINSHTHAAMTLLRGYADDLELSDWLTNHIWPKEAKITPDDVYWGTRLACLEMIHCGTTCFNDMYFHPAEAARASDDAGMRATVSALLLDKGDKEKAETQKKNADKTLSQRPQKKSLIKKAIAIHSVYATNPENIKWATEYGLKHKCQVHTHLSETRWENEDCVRQHGKRPVEYLDQLGALTPNLTAAHCTWLTKSECSTLADRGVSVVHCPVSNMKLATGGVMPYPELKQAGANVALGTDGAASNNSLNMLESMKFAALIQKAHRWDQTVLPAKEAIAMATKGGAQALKIPSGEIAEGKPADFFLLDLTRPETTPHHKIESDLVYSSNPSCVTETIIAGKILMKDGKIDREDEIIEKALKQAEDYIRR
ncbi:5'-deoxyadenosine deaminase [uncultured archaeon]|nr:5'-deoxyadenosine deaminase [uncultured archaeon]